MKNRDNILLYIPAAIKNPNALGGQVTAAKGILKFMSNEKIKFDLVDSANATGFKFFERRVLIIFNFFKLIFFSLFKRYKSSLFFKSTIVGLCIRFIPALILRIKGVNTSIFFRNSQIIDYNKRKINFAKFLLKPYKIIFVQGSNLKKELVKLGFCKEHIHIIPNWIPPEIKINNKVSKNHHYKKKFIFTGNISKEKGVMSILEAIKGDSRSNEYIITFIGTGQLLNFCIDFCKEKGIENVKFLGSLEHNQVIQELRKYDILILPSFSEGFPNSILESLAVGNPVISSNVGEISDTVVDNYNGFIINPSNPQTILLAIHKYLDDSELVSIHSENSIKSVIDRHNFKINCSKLFNILS